MMHADKGAWSGVGKPGGPRDIVIIGAGPAGMSAAIMGGSGSLDTLVIDANKVPGGQLKYSSRIENYPGFPIGISGKQLAKTFVEQVKRPGVEMTLGHGVIGFRYDSKSGIKTVKLDDGSEIRTRAVIIAGGLKFKRLQFPGGDPDKAMYGDSEALEAAAKDKPVVVMGGANSAAQAALCVARSASHVYVLSRKPIKHLMGLDAFQAHRINVVVGDSMKAFNADQRLLRSDNAQKLPATAVSVFIGSVPETSWLPAGVKRHESDGKIVTDENKETGIPGVFAAGDMRHGSIGLIGTSVMEGEMAVDGVCAYFTREQAKTGESA